MSSTDAADDLQVTAATERPSLRLAAFVLIAVLHVGLFSLAATRGLDLTDESYYLLSFRHWADAPAASFFGTYMSLPYLLVGHSLWAIRVVGFLLLLGTGVWFAKALADAIDTLEARTSRCYVSDAALSAGMAVWSYYGAAAGPYTPSYNLLTLACALASCAVSLRLGRALFQGDARHLLAMAFVLGFVASMGIAVKFTAGALILGIDVLILAVLGWRRIDVLSTYRVALGLLAGLVANLALLTTVDHDLVTRFQHAISIALAMLPREPLAELGAFALVEFPQDFIRGPRILLWPFVFAIAAMAIGPRIVSRQLARGVALVGFVVGAMLVIYVKDNRAHRFTLLTLLAISLALGWILMRRKASLPIANGRACLLAAAMVCMPFAYAFGTSNLVLLQMGMAGAFPAALAVSRLKAMRADALIPGGALTLCLLVMAVLPAEIVVRQWLDGSFTYRLGAPLARQTTEMAPNAAGIDVLVERRVAAGLNAFLDLARESGLAPGQPMIDFTGQSPGLVAVCGGVPLGALWLIGGGSFNGDQAARVALGYVSERDIRRAWLLTSDDSFARIGSWREIVEAKLGGLAHDRVGQVTMPDPTSSDKNKTIEVTLWRPSK